MKMRIVSFCFALLFPLCSISQGTRITVSEFISAYRQVAVDEMNLHGIPASIKLAQAILESSSGNSDLARNANNFFGIKCSGWGGQTYFKDDDKPNECFRAYDSPLESFRDHSLFLKARSWYAPLFDLPLTDYIGWANGLQRAGYATNPNYATLLISIIEQNKLQEIDQRQVTSGDDYGQIGIVEPTKPIGTPVDNQPPFEVVKSEVEVNNRIKYIIARQGDTPESIGREHNKQANHIIEYNDLAQGQAIAHGQIIYLQPKRNRGERPFHIMQPNQTMYDISQQYGVKLDFLLSRNQMKPGQQPVVGQRIFLR